jgi:hypothetical protein
MLSNEDMALIRSATVETEQPFSLDDIDEDGRLDTKSRPGTTR